MIKLFASIAALYIMTLISATSVKAERFHVGVIAPLSGALAEYGRAAQNGIELAKSQHADLFSNIDFIYEDSQWDAKSAISAFNRLRIAENVSLIYNWGNPTTEALAPIAEQYKLPLIGMSLDPRVTHARKYVIRSTNSAADFAAVMAQYLKKNGFKKIGVVIAENTYVQGLFDGLQRALGDQAKVEIVDRYNIQDQDFRTSVSKIAVKKYDIIGVFLISGQLSTFYRQLAAQSVSVPSFGTDFFESSTEIQMAKGGMNGAVYPHLGVRNDFKKEYLLKFKNDYQIAYAGNAYDMAIIIGKLFNSGKLALKADEIVAQLKSVRAQDGVGGPFEFRDNGDDDAHYHFPVELKKIVADKIEVLEQG